MKYTFSSNQAKFPTSLNSKHTQTLKDREIRYFWELMLRTNERHREGV